MSSIGTQLQCAVFLSLLTLSPFYCIEESEFGNVPYGLDTSDGIDPEILLEMKPVPEQIYESEIMEPGKKKFMFEYSTPTYSSEPKHRQTYSKTTYYGRKYTKPTYTDQTNLEPTYSWTKTKSINLKPKYPVLFALLKKHLLQTQNSLTTTSSNFKELVVELEEKLTDTSLHRSMESQVEKKQFSPMYPNRDDEEEKPKKKYIMTNILQKFMQALLAKLNRSTEKYDALSLKMEEPLSYDTPDLIVTTTRNLLFLAEPVKHDLEPMIHNLTKHPKTPINIQNEQSSSMYTHQKYLDLERVVEKESKQKVVLPKENYSYIIAPENIALPLSANEVDDIEIFKQNMSKEIINEHKSPTYLKNNSWEDECRKEKQCKIEQSTKKINKILSQENKVNNSFTPNQMTEPWEFITQDLIPTWSEELDELELEKNFKKFTSAANDKTKVKIEQTLYSKNGEEQSKINFKEHLSKSARNENLKENIDNVLLEGSSTTNFPKKTESLKYVTEKLVTTAEEVNEFETKNISTNAPTQVNTKKENKYEQTHSTEHVEKYLKYETKKDKELNKDPSIKSLAYKVSNEYSLNNSSIVKPDTDYLKSGTQEISQVKRGVPFILNLKNQEEFDADANMIVERPKTSISRNRSSWKEFLQDIEKEQQFFFEEPFDLTEPPKTEARNLTDMKCLSKFGYEEDHLINMPLLPYIRCLNFLRFTWNEFLQGLEKEYQYFHE